MTPVAPRHRRHEVRSKAMQAVYRAPTAPSSVGGEDVRSRAGGRRAVAGR